MNTMKRILLLLIFGLFLCGCQSQSQEEIGLDFNTLEYVEYGSEFDTQTLIKEINGSIKDYPILDTYKVGKQTLRFDVILEEQKKSFDTEIEVKDTKKPIIELHKDKVFIDYKAKYKISDYIKTIKDEVDGDIEYKQISKVKDNDVNYYTYQHNIKTDEADDYKIIVTAVDVNGNKATKELIATVKKEETSDVKAPENPKITTTSKPTETQKPVEPTKPVEPNQKDYKYVLAQTIEKTNIAKKVNKIVTFTSTSYSSKSGIAQYFAKENGQWVEKMQTPAIFGSKGMGEGKEGGRKSPIGTYYFDKAYGIKANPGSRLNYTQINDNHYWCGEQYYNQFIDETTQDHSGCSKVDDEHLIQYGSSYNYFVTFNYNPNNTPGKGAAYFMHCKTSSSTFGCIGLAESQLIYLLKNIDTSTALIIDQVSKIKNH